MTETQATILVFGSLTLLLTNMAIGAGLAVKRLYHPYKDVPGEMSALATAATCGTLAGFGWLGFTAYGIHLLIQGLSS